MKQQGTKLLCPLDIRNHYSELDMNIIELFKLKIAVQSASSIHESSMH